MRRTIACLAAMLLLAAFSPLKAEDVTIVAPATEIGEGLDLYAVAQLLSEAEDLEEFEQKLNDPETEINNLDLDGDGQVDYIHVNAESPETDAYLIVLQVALEEHEYQDVATIEVEKESEGEELNVQITGDEEIYGADYYVVPVATVSVRTWPVFRVIYRPGLRPYRSPWRWMHYPKWWKPRAVVGISVYRTRKAPWLKSGRFIHSPKRHCIRVHRHYQRRASPRAVIVKPGAKPKHGPKPGPKPAPKPGPKPGGPGRRPGP